MTEKEKETKGLSRREFLKDAGLLVGGTAIGSTILLAACGGGETETVTNTVTDTVTSTAPGGTQTVTDTVTSTTTVGAEQTATTTTTQIQSTFVCPTCRAEFVTLTELEAHFETAHPQADASMLNVIKITVNRHEYELQVGPADVLHEVLREQLGLTSIKDMCTGWGACGSCSVIADGRPILACMALAAEFDGVIIETAEGVADIKHPLIATYVKHYCMQCGYCTPGFVVTAKALLDHNPDPSVEEIREALGGNLCRCGTYTQHILAVQESAAILQGGE